MSVQSADTHPEVEKILISRLRQTSISKKLKQVISFYSTILRLSRRAIARANPDLSIDERNILFVRYHYGDKLADKLQAFLRQREI